MEHITILAIADRPPNQSIMKTIDENHIDLIVLLGDLDFMILRELQNVNTIPKLGVYGNHCSGNYFEDLGIINMHNNYFEYKGVIFGGMQGCVRYKNDPEAIMFTQEEATEIIAQIKEVDVLLCHCPPRGVNDEDSVSHQGFDGLVSYCFEKNQNIFFMGIRILKKMKNKNSCLKRK